MKGEVIEDDDDPDADYKAIKDNYISVTPVSIFVTDESFVEKLKKLLVVMR